MVVVAAAVGPAARRDLTPRQVRVSFTSKVIPSRRIRYARQRPSHYAALRIATTRKGELSLIETRWDVRDNMSSLNLFHICVLAKFLFCAYLFSQVRPLW